MLVNQNGFLWFLSKFLQFANGFLRFLFKFLQFANKFLVPTVWEQVPVVWHKLIKFPRFANKFIICKNRSRTDSTGLVQAPAVCIWLPSTILRIGSYGLSQVHTVSIRISTIWKCVSAAGPENPGNKKKRGKTQNRGNFPPRFPRFGRTKKLPTPYTFFWRENIFFFSLNRSKNNRKWRGGVTKGGKIFQGA